MSRLAHLSVFVATVLCTGVLLTCVMIFPRMYFEINELHQQVISSVHEFKLNTDAAWTELMDIQLNQIKPSIALTSRTPLLDSIFRPKRANEKLPDYCNCNLPTNCAPGPPGPPGNPGFNGIPGERGFDGQDSPPALHRECGVVPNTCQKCPAGPRGRPGVMGEFGPQGLDGNPLSMGRPGPVGEIGDEGLTGQTGMPGEPGIPGEDAFIFYNPPGEKGRVGNIGLPGPKGPQGKDGIPGPIGEVGEIGDVGLSGKPGIPDNDNGYRGSPGIAGSDAFYCPCPRRSAYYISSIY